MSTQYQGLGGAFLYATDPKALAEWYREIFDLELQQWGATWGVELPSASLNDDGRMATTTLSFFKADGPLPEQRGARLNHRVRDLDLVIERLQARGIDVEGPQDDYGRFAWCQDPEGHRVEIWEPPPADPLAGPVTVVPHGKRLSTDGFGASRKLIQKSITVAAGREKVWALWSHAEGLREWMSPDCRVELRIGGPYEVWFMPDAPEGLRGGDGCRVLSFLAPRMLSFTWNAPPGQAETRSQHTWVIVELKELEAGTRVTITHTGWPEAVREQPWRETFDYFDVAWGLVLGNLAEHLR